MPCPRYAPGKSGWRSIPTCWSTCAPGVGSYVGGDITAGVLCTEIPTNHEEVFLFLDIGTNGEIVLGNADWMVACACSAGPAFEGSGIKMRHARHRRGDRIYRHQRRCRRRHYDVIGGGKPAGICGSGLICLLGELLLRGIIDQSGHFNPDLHADRLLQRRWRAVSCWNGRPTRAMGATWSSPSRISRT